jgi:trimeric autotransporter adhesin
MKERNVTFTTILFVLACCVLLPQVHAVIPAPDGGYPGGNTAEGQNALLSRTSGVYNAAIGWLSLESLTTGTANTGVGAGALALNNGDRNTATGAGALLFNSTGVDNTAYGAFALFNNTVDQNCAFGSQALFSNTTGGTFAGNPLSGEDVGPNVAVGALALGQNTTAAANTAVGYQALGNMTLGNATANEGGFCTAVGFNALASADSSGGLGYGTYNDAFGYEALAKTTTGTNNVGVGNRALFNNTTGYQNTAVGDDALFNNTGIGNTALGFQAGALATTGINNVYIGANVFGAAGENFHTYIGNINTTTVSGGGTDTVTVNLSTGLLGHLSSSRRYKEDIQSMDNASQALFALKPVTFRYKKEIDKSQSLDYGLIAEEVAKIDPNLAVRNGQGQIESVRYNAVNAMLLNEFLKEHKKVEQQARQIQAQKNTIGELKKGMDGVVAQLKDQASQIQRVSAQVKVAKHAMETVAGN